MKPSKRHIRSKALLRNMQIAAVFVGYAFAILGGSGAHFHDWHPHHHGGCGHQDHLHECAQVLPPDGAEYQGACVSADDAHSHATATLSFIAVRRSGPVRTVAPGSVESKHRVFASHDVLQGLPASGAQFRIQYRVVYYSPHEHYPAATVSHSSSISRAPPLC